MPSRDGSKNLLSGSRGNCNLTKCTQIQRKDIKLHTTLWTSWSSNRFHHCSRSTNYRKWCSPFSSSNIARVSSSSPTQYPSGCLVNPDAWRQVLRPCDPSFTLVPIRLAEGFSQGRDRTSSLRISSLAWGEKKTVAKKTQLRDPRLQKTSRGRGEKGGRARWR